MKKILFGFFAAITVVALSAGPALADRNDNRNNGPTYSISGYSGGGSSAGASSVSGTGVIQFGSGAFVANNHGVAGAYAATGCGCGNSAGAIAGSTNTSSTYGHGHGVAVAGGESGAGADAYQYNGTRWSFSNQQRPR